jgi:hypothetical protein
MGNIDSARNSRRAGSVSFPVFDFGVQFSGSRKMAAFVPAGSHRPLADGNGLFGERMKNPGVEMNSTPGLFVSGGGRI